MGGSSVYKRQMVTLVRDRPESLPVAPDRGYRWLAVTQSETLVPHAPESFVDLKIKSGRLVADTATDPKPSPRANDADRHVGTRIRERRVMLGLSQQQLAQMIGVTYQQAHKYERGLNRISAGRLYEIAQVLGVPISWFFEGMRAEGSPVEMSPRQRMCLELARNFAMIDNEKHQEALSQMARALAQAEGGNA